ncbi:hypothetical protein SESBI_27213 [Sesbania bispinosa]|nr:hypothetical protein SESBI_27213 [Sesbania bispinosa]
MEWEEVGQGGRSRAADCRRRWTATATRLLKDAGGESGSGDAPRTEEEIEGGKGATLGGTVRVLLIYSDGLGCEMPRMEQRAVEACDSPQLGYFRWGYGGENAGSTSRVTDYGRREECVYR